MFAALATGVAANAAVVYKWVDADGVVHLSDQPVPGAERIVTDSGSGRSGASSPAPATPTAPQPPKPVPKGLNFTQFAIVSPGQEENFTNNNPVNVSLALISRALADSNDFLVSERSTARQPGAGCHSIYSGRSPARRVHPVRDRFGSIERRDPDIRVGDLLCDAAHAAFAAAQVHAISPFACRTTGGVD